MPTLRRRSSIFSIGRTGDTAVVAGGSALNESTFHRSIEAWNENDWETLEALWGPDGHIIAPEGWPEPGKREGWAEIREQFERIKDSWVEERAEVLAVRPVGDRLFADIRWIVRGEASGAPLEVDMWMLCDFEGGRFSAIEYFLDRDAARGAARGLT
jgi:ketosteroid isomerase-like protein